MIIFRFLPVFWLLVLSGQAEDRQDTTRFIFPNPQEEICIVRAAPGRGTLPAGAKLSPSDPLAEQILEELQLPFHRSVIKLNQCSRNFVGDQAGPNVLYLSAEEGGFPRQGLALVNGKDTRDFPGLNYVDLVIDDKQLADGALSIYSHELGHVMMMNIWANYPERKSPKQHMSMGITDYLVAFAEGWGVHFQRLAYDQIPQYQRIFGNAFDYRRSTRSLWHSRIDEELRINAVPQNGYIWRKMLPDIDLSRFNTEELILLEHASPLFDRTRLKNAQQMLSCEGLIATLIYRINSNPVLQDNYAEPSFYERFLLSALPEGIGPREVFTPFENVILKNFWVWSRLKDKLHPDSIIFVEFVREWAQSFPQDRGEIWNVFISTTVGKTVSEEAGGACERLALSGLIGNYREFLRDFEAYNKIVAGLTARIISGEAKADGNVGPEIWVENSGFLIRRALWSEEEKAPLRINLNTCSPYDLISFPGINLEMAEKIIKAREKQGFFHSLDDAASHGFVLRPR